MKAQRLVLSALLVLLVLAAAGLVLTNSWTNGVSKLAAKQSSSETLVDESPLQTAQQLAKVAVTSDEQQYAGAALRLADHEVDMAFSAALREANRPAVPLIPEAKALQARIARRQARVDSEKENI